MSRLSDLISIAEGKSPTIMAVQDMIGLRNLAVLISKEALLGSTVKISSTEAAASFSRMEGASVSKQTIHDMIGRTQFLRSSSGQIRIPGADQTGQMDLTISDN